MPDRDGETRSGARTARLSATARFIPPHRARPVDGIRRPALKALWWIALIVLVVWLPGFVFRAVEGGGRRRWYRW